MQLDIPADLAYGDPPRGDVIQAGDALTFVIDVRAVVPGDPTRPTQPTAADVGRAGRPRSSHRRRASPATATTLAARQTGVFHLVAARGDDGTVAAEHVGRRPGPAAADRRATGSLPGLAEGLAGMQVGGRRVITLPYDGRLPASRRETDVVIIADLLAVYDPSCLGTGPIGPVVTDRTTAQHLAQVEAEVEDLRRVRELADGDVVDAGLADLAGDLQRQPAAGLEHDIADRTRRAPRPRRACRRGRSCRAARRRRRRRWRRAGRRCESTSISTGIVACEGAHGGERLGDPAGGERRGCP